MSTQESKTTYFEPSLHHHCTITAPSLPQDMLSNSDLCSNILLQPGRGWWIGTFPEYLDSQKCHNLVSWLTGDVMVDLMMQEYRYFDAGYQKAYIERFGVNQTYAQSRNTHSDPFMYPAVWNAMLVVAQGDRCSKKS